MPLFIPTSDLGLSDSYALQDYYDRYPFKGQLYNLDDNKKIWFQFNPEEHEDSIPIRWADIKSLGTPSNQYQYLGESGSSFDLTLLFIADIHMPKVKTQGAVDPNITPDGQAVSFKALYNEIRSWVKPREDTGLPSMISIIFNDDFAYEGFVRELRKRILDQYENGITRRATITLQFQEWKEGRK